MLKTIRRTLAAVSFIGILLLFLDFTGTLHACLSWLASVQLVPAVLALNCIVVAFLLVLTLIFGRIYCSVICPLGIMQDVIARFGISVHNRVAKRKHRYAYRKALPIVRYAVLALFVVLLVAGFTSFAGLLDPYSAFGRIAANLFAPLYGWTNNLFAAVAEHYESYAFYSTDVWVKGGVSLLVAGVTLAVVGVFALTSGRSYCNTICPVGTFLSFFARFSWMKIVIDADRCKGCHLCEHNCKAHCIDVDSKTVDYSRCVVCGNCQKACKTGCIAYGHKNMIDRENAIVTEHEKRQKAQAPAAAGASEANVDNSRRAFLLSAAAVTAGAALAQAEKKVDGGLAAIEDKQIPERKGRLVPAGAQSHHHFYKSCTACQLCISACPNGVLRPSTDLSTLMQPEMQYERGYCRPECNRCSEVCPNDAIRLIDLAEKSSIKIGTARIIKDNCLTAKGVSCGNCARHCPVGAINMINFKPDEEGSVASPVVDPECCIGCGACENLCPVRPLSAIIVDGIDQHRTI